MGSSKGRIIQTEKMIELYIRTLFSFFFLHISMRDCSCWNWLQAWFKEGDDFFSWAFFLCQMDIVLVVDLVPPAHHYMHTYIEESKSFEADHLVLSVCLKVFQEIFWHLCPVESWFNMMCDVISIIEWILIIEVVHALNCQSTIVLNSLQILLHCCDLRIDKDMLWEVAEHHDHSDHDEWDYKHPQSEDRTVLPEYIHSWEPHESPTSCFGEQVIVLTL